MGKVWADDLSDLQGNGDNGVAYNGNEEEEVIMSICWLPSSFRTKCSFLLWSHNQDKTCKVNAATTRTANRSNIGNAKRRHQKKLQDHSCCKLALRTVDTTTK